MVSYYLPHSKKNVFVISALIASKCLPPTKHKSVTVSCGISIPWRPCLIQGCRGAASSARLTPIYVPVRKPLQEAIVRAREEVQRFCCLEYNLSSSQSKGGKKDWWKCLGDLYLVKILIIFTFLTLCSPYTLFRLATLKKSPLKHWRKQLVSCGELFSSPKISSLPWYFFSW